MRRECRKYLYDIQKACELLAEFARGKTLADYSADPLLRSGVERQFEIISPAVRRVCCGRLDFRASGGYPLVP
jgi:uncharacterized protein with HEPN domain